MLCNPLLHYVVIDFPLLCLAPQLTPKTPGLTTISDLVTILKYIDMIWIEMIEECINSSMEINRLKCINHASNDAVNIVFQLIKHVNVNSEQVCLFSGV